MPKMLTLAERAARRLARERKQKGPKSVLEDRFAEAWARHAGGYPAGKHNHFFHPVRKWRFDFAWVEKRVAIELHGGTHSYPVRCDKCHRPVEFWSKPTKPGKIPRRVQVYAATGGHGRAEQFRSDRHKVRAAIRLGWVVLEYVSDDLQEDEAAVVAEVLAALQNAPGDKPEVQRLLGREW